MRGYNIAYANGTIGTTRGTINSRPEVVERVLKATAQATARFKTDPEYAAQIVGKYTQIPDRDALKSTVDVYVPIFTVDIYAEPASVQAVLDNEENPAARTAKVEDLVDYRFADRLRQSGFYNSLPAR